MCLSACGVGRRKGEAGGGGGLACRLRFVVLVCSWRRLCADRHSLPFPSLFLNKGPPSGCFGLPFLFLHRWRVALTKTLRIHTALWRSGGRRGGGGGRCIRSRVVAKLRQSDSCRMRGRLCAGGRRERSLPLPGGCRMRLLWTWMWMAQRSSGEELVHQEPLCLKITGCWGRHIQFYCLQQVHLTENLPQATLGWSF